MKKPVDGIVITGILTDIRYHQSNFLIGKLADGTSIKGPMISPQVGLNYEFVGRWEYHQIWGKTLVFSGHKTSYPTDLEAIRTYLETNAKWVGPEISKQIVESFGAESLVILKKDPERAANEIKGITPDRAAEISTMLRELEDGEQLEVTLNTLLGGTRVSRRIIHKIIEAWGDIAPEIIRTDPYRLVDAINGIGFLTADEVAKKNGYAPEGFSRIRAGILFMLRQESLGVGHVFLPKAVLLPKVQELLRISSDPIAPALTRIAEEKDVVFRGNDVYLKNLYNDENIVARKIKTFLKTTPEKSHESIP